MKQLFKWIVAIILYYTGILYLFRRFNPYSRDGLWILEYHRIANDKEDILKMVVSPKHFRKQMRYLKKKYNVISLKEAVEKIKNYQPLPPYSVAITFDDGYLDNYLNAYPILKKFDIPATIFLTTDYIGSEKLVWFDELVELIKATPLKRISMKFDDFEEIYDLSDKFLKNKLILKLLDMLKNAHPKKRNRYLDEFKILLQVNEVNNPQKILMNWQQIKEMSENGIEFGSHGITHTVLTVLNNLEAEEEITLSKKIIEDKLNKPVFLFCYPNGLENHFNEVLIAKLKNAGYQAACTGLLGKNKEKNDLFKLKRRGIEKESSSGPFGLFSKALFACEISGIFDFLFIR